MIEFGNTVRASAIACLVVVALAFGIRVQLTADIDEIRAEQAQVSGELVALASLAPATGVGLPDYSVVVDDPAARISVDLSWPTQQTITDVVLVPSLYAQAGQTVVADGFPGMIEIAADGSRSPFSTVIYSDREAALPAPRFYPFSGLKTTQLRVRMSIPRPRDHDGKEILQISEILVFSGTKNIAADATITASRDADEQDYRLDYLIDGQLPYEMHGPGEGTHGYRRYVDAASPVILTLALPAPERLERIALYPKDRSISIPALYPPGDGMPVRVRLEASATADFVSVRELLDESIPVTLNSSPKSMRLAHLAESFQYLRLELWASPSNQSGSRSSVALADLELYADGKNVAGDLKLIDVQPPHSKQNRVSSLYDGKNRFGKILETKVWMEQLAERQSLELRLVRLDDAMLIADRNLRRHLEWSALGFLFLVAALLFLHQYRVMRMRALALEAQELLLAELHDEIGASLHAIRMFAELGQAAPEEKRAELLTKMHALSSEAAEKVRRVTHLLDDGVTTEEFLSELRQPEKWLPASCQFEVDIDADAKAMAPWIGIDLGHALRFYHECLANVSRHAEGVSKVRVSFRARSNGLRLAVENNGRVPSDPETVPPSLARRAKLARGRAIASPGSSGAGFRIELRIER